LLAVVPTMQLSTVILTTSIVLYSQFFSADARFFDYRLRSLREGNIDSESGNLLHREYQLDERIMSRSDPRETLEKMSKKQKEQQDL
ncbi:hypothetical protein PFISCL1PPCAC_4926, partial [Pristionchus fissidentatus]